MKTFVPTAVSLAFMSAAAWMPAHAQAYVYDYHSPAAVYVEVTPAPAPNSAPPMYDRSYSMMGDQQTAPNTVIVAPRAYGPRYYPQHSYHPQRPYGTANHPEYDDVPYGYD